MSYVFCHVRAALWQIALLSTVVSEHGTPASSAKAVAGGRGRRLILELHHSPPKLARNSSRIAYVRQLGKRSFASTLSNFENVQYHLKVEVGRTCRHGLGQMFDMVPDTGSSDLWIPGSACGNCVQATSRYDISKSCSAKNLGQNISFHYGDGTTAAGTSLVDQITIGNLHVDKQFMIQVDNMGATTHMTSDGILGLAHHYDVGAERHGRTFLHTVFRDYPDIPQQFSFFLTSNENFWRLHQKSELLFGDGDLARHSKEDHFQYGKAYYGEETSLWLTSVWSLGWNGTGVEASFSEHGKNGAPALVDSGSSLIVLAPDVYDHLIQELRRRLTNCMESRVQQVLSCECPSADELRRIPSLVFNIIDEDDHLFELCMSPHEFISESLGSSCVVSLQKGSKGQPTPIVLGTAFMRSFYTNFDVENHRIGFARSVLSPLPANSHCSTYFAPQARRGVWITTVLFSIICIVFSCYSVMLPTGYICFAAKSQNTSLSPLASPQASPRNIIRITHAAA